MQKAEARLPIRYSSIAASASYAHEHARPLCRDYARALPAQQAREMQRWWVGAGWLPGTTPFQDSPGSHPRNTNRLWQGPASEGNLVGSGPVLGGTMPAYFIADTPELWDELEALSKSRTTVKTAAVGFFSDNSILNFRSGDLLIVDASDDRLKLGLTRTAPIRNAIKRGAEVWSLRGLHAKTIVFGGLVVSGSMNASKSSRDRLVEAALCSNDLVAVADAQRWIEQLRNEKDAVHVTKRFLDRGAALEPKHPPKVSLPKRRRKRKKKSQRSRSPKWWYTWTHYGDFDGPARKNATARIRELQRKLDPTGVVVESIECYPSEVPAELGVGDRMFIACFSGRKPEPVDVWPEAVVLELQRAGRLVYIHHAVPANTESRLIDWSRFIDMTQTVKLRLRQAKVSRVLSPERAEALLRLWPKRTRR